MQHISHSKTTDYHSLISAFPRDGESRIVSMGHTKADAATLRSILNIYSFRPPEPVIDILVHILESPSPSGALNMFLRIVESGDTPPDEHTLPHAAATVLARTLVGSDALARRVAGDRALLSILASIADPSKPVTASDDYFARYRTLLESTSSRQERIAAIHRIQTVEFMRILARNADLSADIVEINAELSALADSVISMCLELAAGDRNGTSCMDQSKEGFIVLGLGKLGGRELNVSSDIDLIYLYNDKNGCESSAEMTRLAERLTRLLSEATEYGFLYRVDTRLRADGTTGPLVRSLRDYFRYLEMRGEAWERQMLLKARPVAGDIASGGVFLAELEHFIFPGAVTRSPNREIAAIKAKIESRLASDGSKGTHLKLRPGGIRDIEFIVQCLQLLTGGMKPEVRVPGTLSALDALKNCEAVSDAEHHVLREAYILYRRVENALQWRELTPASSVPIDRPGLHTLARILGYDSHDGEPGDMLAEDLDRMFRDVRSVFDDVFSAEDGDPFDSVSVPASLVSAGPDESRRFLEKLGFPEPVKGAVLFGRLFDGGQVSIRDDDSVGRFGSVLLGRLADLPDPGGALERFTIIVEAYNARKVLFEILAGSPKLLDLMISVAHSSVFLSDILARDPSLLDWLIESGEIWVSIDPDGMTAELMRIDYNTPENEVFSQKCRLLRNREEIRIGARRVSGMADTRQSFEELTAVAEHIVRAATDRAIRLQTKEISPESFAVVAAGRLGAGTMDFGSDLDLIFVYRGDDNPETPSNSIRLAQTLLSLVGGGGVNKVYDIDARLRPEGGNSVLAVSLEEYGRYLDTRAAGWERLAMIRARPVAGSCELGDTIRGLLSRFVYEKPFDEVEVAKIRAIRAKAVEQSAKRHPGLVNVKSGAGGLSDITFIAQTYAVMYGREHPAVRTRKTVDILRALGEEKLIDRGDARALADAWLFLADVEQAIRIGTGRSVNTVPAEGVEAARIARLLGFRNVPRFLKRIEDVIIPTRERFERMMDRAECGPGAPRRT